MGFCECFMCQWRVSVTDRAGAKFLICYRVHSRCLSVCYFNTLLRICSFLHFTFLRIWQTAVFAFTLSVSHFVQPNNSFFNVYYSPFPWFVFVVWPLVCFAPSTFVSALSRVRSLVPVYSATFNTRFLDFGRLFFTILFQSLMDLSNSVTESLLICSDDRRSTCDSIDNPVF